MSNWLGGVLELLHRLSGRVRRRLEIVGINRVACRRDFILANNVCVIIVLEMFMMWIVVDVWRLYDAENARLPKPCRDAAVIESA